MAAPTTRELGPYAGIGHRFVVRCDHPAVAAYLEAALVTLACDDPPPAVDVRYELTGTDDADRLAIYADGEELATGVSARRAISLLAWHVNRCAIASAVADHVVLHAAAVAREGRALVLPAAMEAGKTTLTAGLIDRGWAYLSDEAAVLTLDGRQVRGYPKPLSIDPGSQEVLAHWRPHSLDGGPASLGHGQWQTPATARPGGRVVAEADVAAVVLPRYEQASATTLTPLSRAHALARAVECAFVWQGEQLSHRFAALAAAVRRSACAELVVGELSAACDGLERFWAESVAR